MYCALMSDSSLATACLTRLRLGARLRVIVNQRVGRRWDFCYEKGPVIAALLLIGGHPHRFFVPLRGRVAFVFGALPFPLPFGLGFFLIAFALIVAILEPYRRCALFGGRDEGARKGQTEEKREEAEDYPSPPS